MSKTFSKEEIDEIANEIAIEEANSQRPIPVVIKNDNAQPIPVVVKNAKENGAAAVAESSRKAEQMIDNALKGEFSQPIGGPKRLGETQVRTLEGDLLWVPNEIIWSYDVWHPSAEGKTHDVYVMQRAAIRRRTQDGIYPDLVSLPEFEKALGRMIIQGGTPVSYVLFLLPENHPET
jgi:hypothetical protein